MGENDDLHDRPEDEDDDEDVEPSNGHVNFGPTPPVTQVPKTRRPRRGRPGGPPAGTGAWEGHAGGKGTRISAMEIWPDLLEELNKSGKTTYELAVRVVCEDPPPTRPIGNAFDASAIVGDRSTSPSDRLYQMVRDNYHMTWAKGPAIYDVQFVWKDGGKIARRGSLQMPHPDEIIGMKQVGGGGFGGTPPRGGYGSPAPAQQQPQYAQPQYQPPPTQYGPQFGQPQWQPPGYEQSPRWQPPQQSPQSDETVQLRAELQRERENSARMQGQLDEILKAMREGRAPNTTPAPAVATPVAAAPAAPPPQQPVDLDGVVFRILDRMGFKPGVGAPPPAATPAPVQLNATDEAVLRVLDRLGIEAGDAWRRCWRSAPEPQERGR